MHSGKHRLGTLRETLRSFGLGPVNERGAAEIEKTVAEALEAHRAQGGGSPDREAAGLALALHRLADTCQAGRVAAVCMAALARLSPFGRVLASGLIRSGRMDLDKAFDCFAELSAHDRLRMTDRMLRDPGDLSPDLRTFALERLAELAEESAVEAARRLRQGDPPAFAVIRACLDGALGRHLRQVLPRSRSQSEMREAVSILARLDPSELEFAMEGRLSGAEPRLALAMLEGLADMGARSEVLGAEAVDVLDRAKAGGDETVARAAVQALLALRPRNLGRVLAECLRDLPALGPFIMARLHALSPGDYGLFRREAGDGGGQEAALRLFVLLGLTDPRRLLACLKWCLADAARKSPDLKPGKEQLRAIQSLFSRREAGSVPPAAPPAGMAPYASREEAPAKAKTAKSRSESFAVITPSGGPRDAARGPERLTAPGLLVRDLVLEGSAQDRPNLTASFVSRSRFSRCVFTGGFFRGAVFDGCRFEDVRFENCDLSETSWHGAAFRRVTFANCDLGGALFFRLDARRLALGECSLVQARLVQSRIETAALANLDASGLALEGSLLLGCSFAHILFGGASADACAFQSVSFRACSVAGFAVRLPVSSHPLVTGLAARTLAADMAGLEEAVHAGMVPAVLEELAQVAECSVRRWFEMDGLERNLRAFQEVNIRREAWCLARLGEDKARFYRMLPFLLHGAVFDRAQGLSPATPCCRIKGYVPDEDVLALAGEYFPGAEMEVAPCSHLSIEAVFTIGSLGSVAQDPDSDLDSWVCARLEEVSEADRLLLVRKLEAVTAWAATRFGMEVHFFLMDVADVRRNNFGFSDEESSGSAQALMLKEEFYRSAMLMAGKPPLWWLVPAGGGERAYAMARIRVAGLMGAEAALDLGPVERIPEEEFFGASLWQIVKGLKSPFKSVMKFGLLERYTGEAGSGHLLCEMIKGAITSGQTALWDADPYVVLYREVADHYRRMGDRESLELITLAFLLKTGLEQAASGHLPPVSPEDRDLPGILSRVSAASPEGLKDLLASATPTFENIIRLGGRVNQFLVNTYTRVRDSMASDSRAAISPEDLTRLGRKIFTTFSKRPGKIEHISFLGAMKASLGELRLSAASSKGGRQWVLEGGVLDEAHVQIRLTELRKGKSLTPLLLWAAFNGVAGPGVEVKADMSVSPLTAPDLSGLLEALAGFFRSLASGESSIAETMKAERITRAFFVLNLTAPREAAALAEAQLAYATNWGELFCVDLPVNRKTLLSDPVDFLREVLPLEVREDVVLGVFAPQRAQCPVPHLE